MTNAWPLLETLLVALLIGGSAAFVLRAAWRAVRTLSGPAAPRGGCGGCGGCGGVSSGQREVPEATADRH